MRIIGGSARGRTIQAPEGLGTRPIASRAKEAIFNMLVSLGGVEGWRVLDLYAGSGSFGLESLSRGASAVTFVERGRPALEALRRNISHLGFEDRSTVLAVPVATALDSSALANSALDRSGFDDGPADAPAFDVAFCDPPYADDPWPTLFARVPADLVVAHTDGPVVLPPGWEELRVRRYGRAHVLIAARAD